MNYLEELNSIITGTEVNLSKRGIISLEKAVMRVVSTVVAHNRKGNKVILIGNGGSAAIAGHIATDLLKNAEIPAVTFSDSSLLTCVSNDLGYENVFRKPVEVLANKGDIMFAISSSGKSKNILNAAAMAKNKGCFLVTLSGFKKDNSLRKLGDINFYVSSSSYGYVEVAHFVICHCIVEEVIEVRKKNG
jgi:D-sedoheptulose 7-phosphate isomerase